VTFRPARAGEGELLGGIGFASWRAGVISTAGGPGVDHQHVREQFVHFCRRCPDTILVAVVEGEPVGWGAREDQDNRISDLWVSPEAQGKGIGRALLEELEAQIERAGHGTAELETAAVNAGAIRFYQRGGYALAWRGVRFSSGLGTHVEKVGLQKRLDVRIVALRPGEA
jgi:ribosomal-protein-alanine N-acetyltransferase